MKARHFSVEVVEHEGRFTGIVYKRGRMSPVAKSGGYASAQGAVACALRAAGITWIAGAWRQTVHGKRATRLYDVTVDAR